jgi:ABC-2 type transport system permease protein
MADNIDMWKELSFGLYCMKKNIQSSAELRTSFLTNVIGMMINNVALLIVWMFFAQAVGQVGGWTAYDMIGLMGFNAISYGAVFSMLGGLRRLPEYTASGAFDRFMLSPKNIIIRVTTSHLSVSAIGDVLYGIVCLVVYAAIIHATLFQFLLACVLIVLVIVVFFSAALVAHSVAFVLTDAISTASVGFELFFTPSMFHGGAFQGALRVFFIFVIPSLLISALPVEVMKNIDISKLALMTVLASLWCWFAIWIFYQGVRRYESANLGGFSG